MAAFSLNLMLPAMNSNREDSRRPALRRTDGLSIGFHAAAYRSAFHGGSQDGDHLEAEHTLPIIITFFTVNAGRAPAAPWALARVSVPVMLTY